jgi:hypothetical protein
MYKDRSASPKIVFQVSFGRLDMICGGRNSIEELSDSWFLRTILRHGLIAAQAGMGMGLVIPILLTYALEVTRTRGDEDPTDPSATGGSVNLESSKRAQSKASFDCAILAWKSGFAVLCLLHFVERQRQRVVFL